MKLLALLSLLAALYSVEAQGNLIKGVVDWMTDPTVVGTFMKAYMKYKIGDNYKSPYKDLSKYATFNLYTRSNRLSSQEVKLNNARSLKNSNFDPSKPTFVITHGYLNNLIAPAIQSPKNALLKAYDCNVFGVDWGKIAITHSYPTAAAEVPRMGEHVAKFIKFLISSGKLDLTNTHLIGHSLGAQISGFAGKNLKGLGLARITGLDPALPGFYEAGPSERIDGSDAAYVDCIHTGGDMLGFMDPICQADFYPNGGKDQPGCILDNTGTCSHLRSIDLYVESVTSQFKATKCSSVPDATGKGCSASSALMGQPADSSMQGLFYVKTNPKSPFAM